MDLSSSSSVSLSRRSARKHRLGAGRSKLSASSSRVKGNVTSSGTYGSSATGIRIIIDGKDCTPLPLVANANANTTQDKKPDTKTAEQYSAKLSEIPTVDQNNLDELQTEERDENAAENHAERLAPEELDKLVNLMLSETGTTTLYHERGICVGLESAEHKLVSDRNEEYQAMCDARATADIYTSSIAQTFNHEIKHKESSATGVPTNNIGCQVTSWDIYDMDRRIKREREIVLRSENPDLLDVEEEEEEEVEEEETEEKSDAKASTTKDRRNKDALLSNSNDAVSASQEALKSIAAYRNHQIDLLVDANVSNPGCLLPVDEDNMIPIMKTSGEEGKAESRSGLDVVIARKAEMILESSNLKEALRTAERGIQQNVFHEKHLLYRAVPAAELKDRAQFTPQSIQSNSDDEFHTNPHGTLGMQGGDDGSNSKSIGEEKLDAGNIEAKDNLLEGVSDDIAGVVETDLGTSEDPRKAESVADEAAVDDTDQGHVNGDVDEKPGLELLWRFHCEESEGRNVSCMSWNKANPDLLAVSYCQFEFNQQKEGLILFWTLKNPEYPEKIIPVRCGVCSIDFSTLYPSLLAAGLYDGTVAIYDIVSVQETQLGPVLDSSKLASHHRDAVWQVKWVNKREKGEVLVSLSTDGRVTEWSMKKGLTSTDLMAMKRVSVPAHLGGGGEGIISRTAAGLCFDFPTHDTGIYYVGTEDGTLHKCSCSYNEQYLETYFGHTGPIYKVKCSPFCPELIMTCSADWSVKLWKPKQENPLLTFQSVDLAGEIHDISWSPVCPTVFGSIASDGRVEIWDLAKSTLDPVITESFTGEDGNHGSAGKPYPSSIAFATNAPIVVVGGSRGHINVYRLRGNHLFDPQEPAQRQVSLSLGEQEKLLGLLQPAASM